MSSTSGNNLKCYWKQLQGYYSNVAISLDLNVPLNHYARCYFPGFVSVSSPIIATAKLINKGINQATYPTDSSNYAGSFISISNPLGFIAPGVLNTPSLVTEAPQIYSGATPVKIKTSYSTYGGYTLDVNYGATLNSPIFYLNFQKGGPIPS